MVFDLIRTHQLNIMLALCAIALAVALLLLITKFVSQRRKWILIVMELTAMFLLWFDRMAYIYSGDVSPKGAFNVRLSNFMVFVLTVTMVFEFNKYILDLFLGNGITDKGPLRLKICGFVSLIDIPIAAIFSLTGVYFYIDEASKYHRGPGFMIAYIVPVIIPLVQLSVILQFRKRISRFIRLSLEIYILFPIIAAIIQVFAYGLSLVNMAMVIAFVLMYVFTYLDINDEVERVHALEMEGIKEEQNSVIRLFDQTANLFVKAVERRDEFSKGRALRIANIAKKIAIEKGMNEIECEDVYYSALLHDVGVITFPDEMVGKEEDLTDKEKDLIIKRPQISAEMLSDITEYPQLSDIAKHVNENYNGTGYPDGLKGEEIPLISRIICVARAYDDMMSPHRTANSYPTAIVREELVKNAGTLYDPEIADIMVKLMDSLTNSNSMEVDYSCEEEIKCGDYMDNVTTGVEITDRIKKISFKCERLQDVEEIFSYPSIVVFDAFDRKVHLDKKTINTLKFLNYAEMWFDGHSVLVNAKNMKVETGDPVEMPEGEYVIFASHFEDHMKIRMESSISSVDAIIALPDKTKSAYIGITGENCHILNIKVEETGEQVHKGDIPRIAEETSYIERMESDIPNVQVDRWRSEASLGIPVRDRVRIDFHSMSLPSANMVWHCPYIVLFHSNDGKVKGEDYREYGMIKTNGESDIENEYSKNRFILKKSDLFPGWGKWQEANRAGMEFKVEVRKRGNRVSIVTEKMGIYIENITTVPDENEDLYVAITGDQVAITDIRVR
ncbi:MAG: HD domain-containing protein [Lachnospiraceae bacterium]|nr:HD domain-containing protein [Lachnospiraceae bacterium]